MVTNTRKNAEFLEAARLRLRPRYLNGEIRSECRNKECSLFDVRLTVNEAAETIPSTLRCPACQEPLTIRRVLTSEELSEGG